MLKSETCEPSLAKVKGYDIEKGRADNPKPTEECVIKNSKNDDSRARTLLRDVSSQIGGKLMLLFMKNGSELPKFTSRERGYETASNRSRKYKRTSSFNSRRVVLISSVLSIMGTIILIYLTLRARQISDGPSAEFKSPFASRMDRQPSFFRGLCIIKVDFHCVSSSQKKFSFAISGVAEEHHGSIPFPPNNRAKRKQHHLWKKRDSSGSGQKALNLVQIASRLPIDKEGVYGALDEWVAWETEFPSIAAAKAIRILTKRRQWKQVIKIAKWMLSRGQCATMSTYDSLLLALDMDGRVDEAETLWNVILSAHGRSISRRLFSRMISLYDHHEMPGSVIEVFADMEELGVKPDEDSVRRVGAAFRGIQEEEKGRSVLAKYQLPYRYIHFKGERVRVRVRN
ncbi:hypothetical protein M569_11004 [Genlisea aurea]|uniref:Pentacotripeptide-repeat region of PRORP domain-containing protein n=1 Tax=Genlisea aurea TaxID=192259 RepID=S8DLI2_9LAMI|nr:hypothetical protein M569_11004 [Genlisea aurea]